MNKEELAATSLSRLIPEKGRGKVLASNGGTLDIPSHPPSSSSHLILLPPPSSELMARLHAFLPQIKSANENLLAQSRHREEGEKGENDEAGVVEEALVLEEITDESSDDGSEDRNEGCSDASESRLSVDEEEDEDDEDEEEDEEEQETQDGDSRLASGHTHTPAREAVASVPVNLGIKGSSSPLNPSKARPNAMAHLFDISSTGIPRGAEELKRKEENTYKSGAIVEM